MKESVADKVLGDQKIDYALNKIEEAEWDNPKELVEAVADAVDVDRKEFWPENTTEAKQLVDSLRVSDNGESAVKVTTVLEDIAQEFDVNLQEEYRETNIDKIHEIENRRDKCYLVQVDCTDKQLPQLNEQVKSELVKKQGRIDALVFIRNDVTEVSELSPEDVKESVKPWLQSQDKEADN